jgi:hypothetical protein
MVFTSLCSILISVRMQSYEDSLVAQLETELVVCREAAWHNRYCVLLFIPLLDLTDRQLVLEHNAESRGALLMIVGIRSTGKRKENVKELKMT